MKHALIALALVAALGGCKTSPTGRTQVALYSDSEMSQLGGASFEQMKKEQKINKDPATNAYVQCVADAVITVLPQQYAQQEWEVVVFDEPSANAFALPGGYIGVHTGLLDVAQNQDQLATVLGHEVGHVIAEHSNERVSQSQLLQTGMQLGAVALDMSEVSYRNEIMQALGLGAQFGVVLPFSRTHESEADEIGLELMAKAGFEPQQSVALWQNMAKQGGARQPEFLSTHPAPSSRITQLQKQMTNAQSLYNSAQKQGKRPQCR
ncbi:Zn-dependent protease with chaperone function PA4632 [Pseudoalteromonas sp. SW0106-04]|uniref:M48 family metallopeptidase n=1 Tax=Pseudoalteromonas sp. SW0106-04 TaxID=1702169 RepID=UPI0006B5D90A|nr:M48 family metallopeptidase [Pseudoalteromonas sp. SW0106-04]GAP76596.1 Zn-dependent protease with chaperone function PA4632 [Pseudoalteromonas sp. SW0106-04]